MTVVNYPYITTIVEVCSIIGRNLSLYGVIMVVKKVVAVAERVCAAAMVVRWCGGGGVVAAMMVQWCGGGGMCACDDGAVVAVERVCMAVMVVSGCCGEGESSCSVYKQK